MKRNKQTRGAERMLHQGGKVPHWMIQWGTLDRLHSRAIHLAHARRLGLHGSALAQYLRLGRG